MIRLRRYLWPALCALITGSLACSLTQRAAEVLPDLPGGDRGAAKSMMLLVVDAGWNPIPGAIIGEDEGYTDSNGIATGSFSQTGAGWVRIEAAGYTISYAKPISRIEDSAILIAKLSPIESSALVTGGAAASVLIGDPQQPDLVARFEPGIFEADAVVLDLSTLTARSSNAQHAPLSGGGELYWHQGFTLTATDLAGESIPLGPNGSVVVDLRDPGTLSDSMALAGFDPDAGQWDVLEGACARVGTETIRCTLPHLSEFGFFDPNRPPDPPGNGKSSEEYDDALADVLGMMGAGDSDGGRDEGAGAGAAGGLEDALNRLARAASTMANENPSEQSKAALANAASLAGQAGMSSLAQSLIDQAKQLTDQMAEDLLKDPDCKTKLELLNMAYQAGMFGSQGLMDQLINKAREIENKCSNWIGWIEYMFVLSGAWPEADEWIRIEGAETWREAHYVEIHINPETGAIDGESRVTLTFSSATFLHERGSRCGPLKHHRAIETGGGGKSFLIFQGSTDGTTFSIGPMQVEKGDPVSLEHHQWMDPDYGENCAPFRKELGRTFIADYTTQLIHGFFGQPEPPSLEEMLNSGTRGIGAGGRDTIFGSRNLSYSVGGNLSPMIPVSSGVVIWRFTRIPQTGE